MKKQHLKETGSWLSNDDYEPYYKKKKRKRNENTNKNNKRKVL